MEIQNKSKILNELPSSKRLQSHSETERGTLLLAENNQERGNNFSHLLNCKMIARPEINVTFANVGSV